ncbi:MAG: ABC transporter ATP-binding protein, partial [Bacteroidales bacterium]|nr:ABC transporter ATP-binding protein [Bacteroidales bacterium]
MDAEVLSLNAIKIGYKGKKTKVIASNITASLERGSLTALLGLNGSGKSTLIKTLCGFIPAIEGEIKICGRDVKTYSATEFALTVGVVLTTPTSAGGLTAKEMVALGRHPHTGFWGRLSQQDYAIVERAMNAVGIAEKADHYVSG